MDITFLGGTNEIGASCLLINVAGVRILIDAGLRPKAVGEAALPALDHLADPPDVILLTHAHIDHIGALPVVHKLFPRVPVFASEPTRALTEIMLLDSAKLQNFLPGAALYNEDDVEHTLSCLRSLFMNRWHYLAPQVALCFIPAGHLLGAVSILLDTSEGRVVISGDISLTHQRAVPGFSAPNFPADVLILESTYGDGIHPDRQEEERRLVESVTEVVLAGGTALIPSFALGRAQEVILTLRQAHQQKETPLYPIFVDGLVRTVTDVYNHSRSYLTPTLQKNKGNLFWHLKHVIKVSTTKQRYQSLEQPACIVSSSGMLVGGPSVFYARHLIGDSASAIFITGYTDEESPSRKLQQLASGDELTLNGQKHKVACQVRKFGLSGHADAEQLVQVVEHFKPRQIYLVHGEDGRGALNARLQGRYQVHLPVATQKVKIKPPNWLIPHASHLLDEDGTGKGYKLDKLKALAGEPPQSPPKLGIKYETIVKGALVRESIPSQFSCLYCGGEKLVTIDLSKRQLRWHCADCGKEYQENILNLRQKDVSKLFQEEQEILADLILVSLRLHELTLGKNWAELLANPVEWKHWLT